MVNAKWGTLKKLKVFNLEKKSLRMTWGNMISPINYLRFWSMEKVFLIPCG